MIANGIFLFDADYPRTRIPLIDAFREEFSEHYIRDLQARLDTVLWQ